MNTVLLWIGGVLVVVLCALFAVPHFVNWNLYRGAFEEEASRLLARDVRVSGGVSVRFLPVPYVSFEKVRIGDLTSSGTGGGDRADPAREPTEQTSTGGEPVLRVERFTMGLSITDLLRGSIAAHEIEMVRPEIRVALGEQGANLLGLLSPSAAGPLGAPRSATTDAPGSPGERLATGRQPFQIDTLVVTDGTITVLDGARGDALVITAITGEIGQVAAGGAPKFRGVATFAGEARDIRIASADAGGGSLKVKSTARGLVSNTTYGFDGSVAGMQSTLAYDGDVTAKLPVGSLRAADGLNPTAIDGFELRGRVKGGAKGLGLDELVLSFERDGQPQTINGAAKVSWGGGTLVTADFSSRWLDLDRIFRSEAGARPADIAAWLQRSLAGVAPIGTSLAATLDVESLTLGAEQLAGVSARIAAKDGAASDVAVTARVPSGRVEIVGRTSVDRKSFEGRVFATAQSARRFLAWLAMGTGLPAPRVDGTLLVDAAFTVEPTAFSLRDAAVEIGGQSLRGGIGYTWTTRPTVRIDIAADRLSVGGLVPRLLSTEALQALAGVAASPSVASVAAAAKAASTSPHEITRLVNLRDLDLAVTARIGDIDDGETRLTDLAASVSSTAQVLQIDRLGFRTTAGTLVDVRGRVQSAASDPRGALTIDVSGESQPSIEQILALAPIVAGERTAALAPRLAPLRLSAAITLGEDGTRRDRIVLDGSAATSRIYARGLFERGVTRWATERVEVHGAVAGREAAALAALMAPSAGAIGTAPPSDNDRFAVTAAGIPRTGVRMVAGMTVAGTTAAFEGRSEIPADGPLRSSGRVVVTAGDARQLAAWAGVTTIRLPVDLPVSGTFDVTQDARSTALRLVDVVAGGVAIAGDIAVPRAAGPTPADAAAVADTGFVADLTADQVGFQRLFEPFLLARATPAVGAVASVGDGFPDTPFDLGTLTASRGRLMLAARSLRFDGDLDLPNARLTVVLGPAGIDVTELSGEPLGGRLSARFKLQPEGSDIAIGGSVKLGGLSIAAIGGGSTGTVGGDLAFAGRGLTPRALLQFLTGAGTVTLVDVVAAGIEPDVVAQAVVRAAAGDQLAEGSDVSALVADVLATGRLAIRRAQVPLELGRGALKIGDIRADTAQATVRNRTTVDLVGMRADIDWRITPTAKELQVKGRSLPSVGLVYAGPIGKIARLGPRIQSDELGRELSLRRLERSVDELEQLRRQDEERARLEAERRRKLEDEQAAAIAAAAEAAAATATGAIAVPPAPSSPSPMVGPPAVAAPPTTGIVPTAPVPAQRRSQRAPGGDVAGGGPQPSVAANASGRAAVTQP